jgi:hypothetical protein
VGFKSPATVSANKIWTLPNADGSNGQVLSTNGSGTLSWATAGGSGPSFISVSISAYDTYADTNLWQMTISETLDTASSISISSNRFNLAAGTYMVQYFGTILSTNGIPAAIMRNVTDSSDLANFGSYNLTATGTRRIISPGTHIVTLSGTKSIEFRYYNDAGSNTAPSGLGPTGFNIIKVA